MENIRVSCVHSIARCEGLPSDGKSSPWISRNLAKQKKHLPTVSVIRHPFFPRELISPGFSSTVNFRLRLWQNALKISNEKSDTMKEFYERFRGFSQHYE